MEFLITFWKCLFELGESMEVEMGWSVHLSIIPWILLVAHPLRFLTKGDEVRVYIFRTHCLFLGKYGTGTGGPERPKAAYALPVLKSKLNWWTSISCGETGKWNLGIFCLCGGPVNVILSCQSRSPPQQDNLFLKTITRYKDPLSKITWKETGNGRFLS